MMMYHLRKLSVVSGIVVDDIVQKIYDQLKILNKKKRQEGSIGWGIPMLYVATKEYDDVYSEAIREISIQRLAKHKNFRTRAIGAWALTMRY